MNSPSSTLTPSGSTSNSNAADVAKRVVDKSAEAAQHALSSGRGAANRTLDGLSNRIDSAQDVAAPAVQHAVERTQDLGHQTMELMRSGAQQLRDQAQHARDASVVYVRQEPLKSMLMAAAVGAGLMAIATLFMRRS